MAKQNIFVRAISKIPVISRNFQLLPPMGGITSQPQNIPEVQNNAHAPRNYMIPLQLQRIKQDAQTWRLAIDEAENAYYPHRFRMQQMFVDTILEGHTRACMRQRKALSLLKEFKIGKKGEGNKWIENENASKIFAQKMWFKNMLSYILDAQFYGYSLIQMGDLLTVGDNYEFKDLTILKRWNVSPDRKQLVQIPYQTWGISIHDKNYYNRKVYEEHEKRYGISFTEDVDENGVPFNDWMIYVDTPSDIGASICGYGLLYEVALYGIILRNNLAHNSDYTQMFAAPYRHIKTPEKYGTEEYNNLEKSAQDMGSFGYLLTGTEEEVNFIAGNTGTGHQAYDNLEKRLEAKISKVILGHANALDAQATALGGGSAGKKTVDEDSTPEGKAKMIIEKEQDDFLLNVLNTNVYPKLKNLGFPLKDDECFYVLNDKEEFEIRKKEDAANLETATIAQMMKNAGLQMDASYFADRTGIPTTDAPAAPMPVNIQGSNKIKAKLQKIYSHKH